MIETLRELHEMLYEEERLADYFHDKANKSEGTPRHYYLSYAQVHENNAGCIRNVIELMTNGSKGVRES